jgi:hypothetical protein
MLNTHPNGRSPPLLNVEMITLTSAGRKRHGHPTNLYLFPLNLRRKEKQLDVIHSLDNNTLILGFCAARCGVRDVISSEMSGPFIGSNSARFVEQAS